MKTEHQKPDDQMLEAHAELSRALLRHARATRRTPGTVAETVTEAAEPQYEATGDADIGGFLFFTQLNATLKFPNGQLVWSNALYGPTAPGGGKVWGSATFVVEPSSLSLREISATMAINPGWVVITWFDHNDNNRHLGTFAGGGPLVGISVTGGRGKFGWGAF